MSIMRQDPGRFPRLRQPPHRNRTRTERRLARSHARRHVSVDLAVRRIGAPGQVLVGRGPRLARQLQLLIEQRIRDEERTLRATERLVHPRQHFHTRASSARAPGSSARAPNGQEWFRPKTWSSATRERWRQATPTSPLQLPGAGRTVAVSSCSRRRFCRCGLYR